MTANPYPGYKDSGRARLGKIPESWSSVPLKYVASYNDEVLAEDTDPKTEIEYIEISDVAASTGISGSTRMLFEHAPSRARRVLRKDDVVVSTVRTYLRAVAQVPPNFEGAIASTGFTVLRSRRIDSSFLGFAAMAESFVSEVIARSVGVSYPAINSVDLVRVAVPLPSKSEQRQIADYLDAQTAKIDALIGKQERLIETLVERRQAVIDGYFRPSASTRATRLRNLLASKPTYGVLVPAYVDDEDAVPFIRVGDLPGLESATPSARISETQSNEYSRTRIVGGEVLLGVVGRMGQVTVAPERLKGANVARAVGVMRCSDVATSELLAIWLTSTMFLHQAGLSTSGDSVQPTLGMGDLAGFRLQWPKDADTVARTLRELRNQIAVIDDLRSKAEQFIALSNERRSALISAAVTGKIDVRGLV